MICCLWILRVVCALGALGMIVAAALSLMMVGSV